MADTTNGPPLVSEGLALAGATLVGYAAAFAHEAGYVSHFGVPLDLVSLDITAILVTTAGLLALAWTLFIMLNPLSNVLQSGRLPEPLRERLGYLLVPCVLLIAYYHFYGFYGPSQVLLPIVAVIAFALSWEFLLPLVTQRKTRGYRAKLAAANVAENRPDTRAPLHGWIAGRLGPHRVFLLFWIGFAIYVANLMGRAEATKREWFHCPSALPDVVLVRTYGLAVVGAKYDPRSHHLVGELVLGTRGEGPWANLKWRKVGPLVRDPHSRGGVTP